MSWNLFAVEPIFQVSGECRASWVCLWARSKLAARPVGLFSKLTSLYPSKAHTLKVYNTLLKHVITCTNMQRWQWPVLEPDDQVFLITNNIKESLWLQKMFAHVWITESWGERWKNKRRSGTSFAAEIRGLYWRKEWLCVCVCVRVRVVRVKGF